MIQKILVLLIIYCIFFSHNDYSFYSYQNKCLFSSSEKNKLIYYNVNNVINANSFSISLSKCVNTFNKLLLKNKFFFRYPMSVIL